MNGLPSFDVAPVPKNLLRAWRHHSTTPLFVLLTMALLSPAFAVPPVLRLTSDPAIHSAPLQLGVVESPPSAQIRYTLDGSLPTASHGLLYTAPIQIGRTTVSRWIAFTNGTPASPLLTRTYLFPEDILRQPANPKGFPTGDSAWQGEPAHYSMDPRVVSDKRYEAQLLPALRALPSLSVVCNPADLFGNQRGIYLNTQDRGPEWERPCSLEWIEPNGTRAAQADCAIRIQGNTGRRPDKTPKHSFRLVFKKSHGPGKFRYRVFPDSNVTEFDTLVLRADYNNAWTHWKPEDNRRAQRTRDAWVKDTHRAMGHLAAHSRYVHLYLNGLYWGIYDVAERPDASFAASYLGGTREDYDVLDDSGVKNGTRESRRELVGFPHRNAPVTWDTASTRVDLPQFIDYLLLNFYVGNQDWGEYQNWYAIRSHSGDTRFRYYVWDGEITLQSLNDDVVNDPDRPPFALSQRLRSDPEFRLAFADRVQRHCFGSGSLTPQASIARWKRRAEELNLAILAESARWGYVRRSQPFTRDRDWMTEQQRLLDTYFPRRTEVVLQQLRIAGLYPKLDPPAMRVGSNPTETLPVQISFDPPKDPSTEIHFTRDGTDPRTARNGTPSPTAWRYNGPIALTAPPGPTLIKARALKGSEWSALVEFSRPSP